MHLLDCAHWLLSVLCLELLSRVGHSNSLGLETASVSGGSLMQRSGAPSREAEFKKGVSGL